MWQNIKDFILRLFGRKPVQTDGEIEHNREDTKRYADTTRENITAIVARILSVLSFGDADVIITGDSKRAEYLQSVSEGIDIMNNVECGLGTGAIVSIPYSTGGKIYIDTVMKDRFFITSAQGDEITGCTVIADIIKTETHTYTRWTDYTLENGTYVIRQKATVDDRPEALTCRTEWADIPEEIRIGGVDRLPIGIFTCPASPRRPKSLNGVPITYGCESTLEKIAKTLEDIEIEFGDKKVFVGIDETLFDGKGKLPIDRVFKTFISSGASGEDFFKIFDPAFRESAYYTKLTAHFAMLEKQIGCSKGILTELDTRGATATEIRRSMYTTFCLCDKIHENFVKYFDGLMYGVNILCNYFGITPQGDYEIAYDWSYALLEDSAETFNQLKEGKAMGVVEGAEVRHFMFPDETIEESREAVEGIRKNNPTMAQMMGDE